MPEIIPDLNDPFRVEWTDVSHHPSVLYAHQADRNPDMRRYRMHYPIRKGRLNMEQHSREALMNDIESLWAHTITTELGVGRSSFEVGLLAPNLTLISMLVAIQHHLDCA